MKRYDEPVMKVTDFSSEAILTASGVSKEMTEWESNNDGARVVPVDWKDLTELTSVVF